MARKTMMPLGAVLAKLALATSGSAHSYVHREGTVELTTDLNTAILSCGLTQEQNCTVLSRDGFWAARRLFQSSTPAQEMFTFITANNLKSIVGESLEKNDFGNMRKSLFQRCKGTWHRRKRTLHRRKQSNGCCA